MKTTILMLIISLMSAVCFSQDVTIGTQVWQSTNLNVGTQIGINQLSTDNNVVEKYCYNNNPTNCTLYGGLYDWNEIMNYSKGGDICGEGYHVPTDADWQTLIDFYGGAYLAGRELKVTGFVDWNWPRAWNWPGYSAAQKVGFALKVEGTNSSGFSAKGGGYGYGQYGFSQWSMFGYWWTATKDPAGWLQQITMTSTAFSAHKYPRFPTGSTLPKFSVRCIKN